MFISRSIFRSRPLPLVLGCTLSALLAGCIDTEDGSDPGLPQLSAASGGTFSGSCAALAGKLAGTANTTIRATSTVAEGTLTIGG